MRFIVIFTKSLFIFFVIVIYAALIADVYVSDLTEEKVTFNINKIESKDVGLLLGTSKILPSGRLNSYYSNRIRATYELYKEGKIKFVLISGDNSSKNYNEPKMMQEDLVNCGFPKDKIFLDFAGFSTYESVYRCWKIFGQKDLIVISQKFHNQRAIYIASELGLKMQGYNAKDVNKFFGFKTNLREKFARIKLLFETFFKPKPKFLGEQIEIK